MTTQDKPYDPDSGRFGYCTQTISTDEHGWLVSVHDNCPLHSSEGDK